MEYRKNKIRLLLACNDNADYSNVKNIFSKDNYYIHKAACGKQIIELATSLCPELIVIAGSFSDMNTNEIITNLRSWSNSPIIIMEKECSSSAQVKYLYAGADDYISVNEEEQVINARIHALTRRITASGAYKPYRAKQLVIDFEKRKILFNGNEVHMSPVEYKILECLAAESGSVVTYQQLINKIWGPYMENDSKILRVNMANIRKKIEPKHEEPEYIFTVSRVGYRMLENENVKA